VLGVGAADRVGSGFRQADVQDRAFLDELGQGAYGLLDGRAPVDAVLIVQVDAVGTEPLERALDGDADAGRAAVGDAGGPAGVGDDAELGGNDHLVPTSPDCLADKLFAVEGPEDLGGVDVGDAQVERTVDGADRLGVVETTAGRVDAGHGHHAQADAGDVEISYSKGGMQPPLPRCCRSGA
jgi:hypothetical protein